MCVFVRVYTRLEKQTIGDSRTIVIKKRQFNHTVHEACGDVNMRAHREFISHKYKKCRALTFTCKMWHISATVDVIISDNIY